MAVDDLGAELWALVYHLFHKYRRSPARAAQELALRTSAEWHVGPGTPAPQTAPDVVGSPWYAEMCSRYAALLRDLHAAHERDVADATEMVSSLYPDGCNVSEYADALRTSAAVLPCLVPSDCIDFLIHKRGLEFHEIGRHELVADDLVRDVIEDLMLKVLIPRQWWCRGERSLARVTRTGIRGTPPALLIEYEWPAATARVRCINLRAHLRPDMPTAQLARRLATTHAALLSESQFQALLIRCQRLMARAPSSPPAAAAPVESAAAQPDAGPPPPTPTSATLPQASLPHSSQPQKADLGLLYRDPDAALDNVDLNDADEVTLQEFKEVMNERFKANVIKPGDPGYVYDRRVEVTAPAQKSEWDDDSD